MTIRMRIMTLAGTLVLVALAVTGLALSTLSDYDRMMSDYGRAYENAFVGEKLNNTVSRTVMASRGIYLAGDQAEANDFANQLETELDAMPALIERWRGVVPPEHMGRIQKIESTTAAFISLRRTMVQLTREGRIREAEQLGLSNRNDRIAFQDDISVVVDASRTTLETTKSEAAQFRAERTTHFLLAAGIGTALMLLATVWLTSHFITVPLQNIAGAIVRTSEGDYDAQLAEPKGDDEVSKVWRAISVLREKSKEAERLAAEQAEAARLKEMELRQIVLD